MSGDGQKGIRKLSWWRQFWDANDSVLYGRKSWTTEFGDALLPRSYPNEEVPGRIPVLVELGEDWIIRYTGAN